MRASFADYYERLHRIVLQLMRAFYKTPHLMRYQGDGGAYQVAEWRNVDLGSTRQVRVRRNTFTTMMPTAKAGLIAEKLQAGMITPQEASRLDRENMSPLLGLTENPHVERVKRQLWLWRQGPSEQQQQMPPAPVGPMMDPNTGQPAVDPNTGQPMMRPPVDPLIQVSSAVFAPVPVDADPAVAVLRYQELGAACADAEMSGFPPGWVQGLFQAAEVARQAAGVVTIAEQQMMAQQQVQQQQQAQAQQQDSERSQSENARSDKKESEAAKQETELQREQIRAGSRTSGMMQP